LVAIGLLVVAPAACAGSGPKENSVMRAARERQRDRAAAVQELSRQDLQALTLAIAEDRIAVQQLVDKAAEAAGRRRQALVALAAEDQALQQAQLRLLQRRQQRQAAEQELQELAKLTAAATARKEQLQAAAQEAAALAEQVAAMQAEAAAQSAALLTLRDQLSARLQQLEAARAAADAALPSAPQEPQQPQQPPK
jgi:DNA recombination protein RmuC